MEGELEERARWANGETSFHFLAPCGISFFCGRFMHAEAAVPPRRDIINKKEVNPGIPKSVNGFDHIEGMDE